MGVSFKKINSFKLLLENRKKLLEKRNTKKEEMNSCRKEMASNGHECGDDLGDAGNENETKEELCLKIERCKREMELIDKALREIDNASYGNCEICGCHISIARLRAKNDARTCIDCASK